MKKIYFFLMSLVASLSAWAIEQDNEGYYLIGSVEDWDAFAAIVAETPTANAKMTADVNLGDDQTMIGSGTSDNNSGAGNVVYQGSFDGQGHSLTVNYNSTELFTAPFRHIQGATIKNLHVKGNITTSSKWAAGIVSGCYGNQVHSYVQNCVSSVVIISSFVNPLDVSYGPFYSASHHAGIVAHLYCYGQLHIEDCLFDGEINGEHSSTAAGGLCGFPDGTVNVVNCLQKGTFDLSDIITGSNGSGTMSCTFGNGYASRVNVTNSYYLNPLGNIQGTQVTDEQLADGTIATALQAGRDEEVWVQDEATGAPMLKVFLPDDTQSGIEEINAAKPKSGQRYNLMGQPVGQDYRGIVIEDGKKLIVR